MLDKLWRADPHNDYKYFNNFLNYKTEKDILSDLDNYRYNNLNYFKNDLVEKAIYLYHVSFKTYYERNHKEIKRVDINQLFFYIDFENNFKIIKSVDKYDEISSLLFKSQNYFQHLNDAEQVLKITNKLLYDIHKEVLDREYNLSITTRWRANIGDSYWRIAHIDDEYPYSSIDNRDPFDDKNYINGNYFKTYEEAYEMLKKIKQLLKTSNEL